MRLNTCALAHRIELGTLFTEPSPARRAESSAPSCAPTRRAGSSSARWAQLDEPGRAGSLVFQKDELGAPSTRWTRSEPTDAHLWSQPRGDRGTHPRSLDPNHGFGAARRPCAYFHLHYCNEFKTLQLCLNIQYKLCPNVTITTRNLFRKLAVMCTPHHRAHTSRPVIYFCTEFTE